MQRTSLGEAANASDVRVLCRHVVLIDRTV